MGYQMGAWLSGLAYRMLDDVGKTSGAAFGYSLRRY